MNNMDENMLSQILMIALGTLIILLIILSIIFVTLKLKEKNNKKEKKKERVVDESNVEKKLNAPIYNKQSIYDFMEFDKIEDNMIIQKNGKRFLMVVECQGVNYDLMSKMEKIGVEEGFQQFLNTLRHPIQIYIQTRTVNLNESISKYKLKVKEVEDKYNQMLFRYNSLKNSDVYNQQELESYWFELTKQRNLLEYGRDIVSNTEKMSLNKSILNKKYYIVIPYFAEENNGEKYDKEEIRSMAFSELYTKSQSIIRTLSSCSINGRILTSIELVDLLYVAYNRDESEVFGIDKAIRAGYEELYSTAPDVYEKKIRILDETIRNRAIDLANEKIEKVKSRPQKAAQDREDNLEELIRKMATMVIEENRRYVGEDIAEEAIKEINSDEEGGNSNEEIKKKTTRGRKKKTVN
ncbi:MAG: hypothetical protein ACLR9X_07040 [Clostridia bacterium]|nr:hypothetical protein [Clostridium sp.]